MADDFGRVNPVSPHFVGRGAREEPYQGRHSKKHASHDSGSTDSDADDISAEEVAEPVAGSHIDLRI